MATITACTAGFVTVVESVTPPSAQYNPQSVASLLVIIRRVGPSAAEMGETAYLASHKAAITLAGKAFELH